MWKKKMKMKMKMKRLNPLLSLGGVVAGPVYCTPEVTLKFTRSPVFTPAGFT